MKLRIDIKYVLIWITIPLAASCVSTKFDTKSGIIIQEYSSVKYDGRKKEPKNLLFEYLFNSDGDLIELIPYFHRDKAVLENDEYIKKTIKYDALNRIERVETYILNSMNNRELISVAFNEYRGEKVVNQINENKLDHQKRIIPITYEDNMIRIDYSSGSGGSRKEYTTNNAGEIVRNKSFNGDSLQFDYQITYSNNEMEIKSLLGNNRELKRYNSVGMLEDYLVYHKNQKEYEIYVYYKNGLISYINGFFNKIVRVSNKGESFTTPSGLQRWTYKLVAGKKQMHDHPELKEKISRELCDMKYGNYLFQNAIINY